MTSLHMNTEFAIEYWSWLIDDLTLLNASKKTIG